MSVPVNVVPDPNLVQAEIIEQPERAPFDPVTEVRTLILGLKGSGKTSALYKLCFDEFRDFGEPKPTSGYNVATLERGGDDGIFHIWDLSGSETFLSKWKYFFTDVRAVIYVIDTTDADNFYKMREEIIALHNDEELSKASFLFLANKIDLSSSWPKDDIIKQLGLKKLYRRAWNIIECVAFSGHGLEDGIAWLWTDVNTHPDDKTYIEDDPEPEPEVLPFGENEGNMEGEGIMGGVVENEGGENLQVGEEQGELKNNEEMENEENE